MLRKPTWALRTVIENASLGNWKTLTATLSPVDTRIVCSETLLSAEMYFTWCLTVLNTHLPLYSVQAKPTRLNSWIPTHRQYPAICNRACSVWQVAVHRHKVHKASYIKPTSIWMTALQHMRQAIALQSPTAYASSSTSQDRSTGMTCNVA